MVDNNLLDHYRAGIRRILSSQADEEIRTIVPEFQSIILEEMLSFAKKEIVGVYNCAKGNLWTQKATEIVNEKIQNRLERVETRIVYVPSNNEYIGEIRNLKGGARFLPRRSVLRGENVTTLFVVDGKITLAVGDKDDKPLLLYPSGVVGFTAQILDFASDLWEFSDGDSDSMERSHE